MSRKPVRGLFITGTDTEIGKTYARRRSRSLVDAGHRVGMYKPAASGCSRQGDSLLSDDALTLWQAAGSPGTLDGSLPTGVLPRRWPRIWPQRPRARRSTRRYCAADSTIWLERSEVVLVEGAGGLMSPLGEEEFVADLAYDLRLSAGRRGAEHLGTINHVLQTLIAAATFRDGLTVAGIVLNETSPHGADSSRQTNASEIRRLAVPPVLAEIGYQAGAFDPPVDWFKLAAALGGAIAERMCNRAMRIAKDGS